MNYLITEITQRVMNMILCESYNADNFFKHTQAVFTEAEVPKRKPDYISTDRYGCVSSEYWYTDEGVYRESFHWSLIYINGKRDIDNPHECYDIKSCWWIFDAKNSDAFRGFCPWSDFLPFDGENLNIEALENKMQHKI